MPFMDEPPGAKISVSAIGIYGAAVRKLRSMTNATVNKEPKWRHNRPELTTGYHSTAIADKGASVMSSPQQLHKRRQAANSGRHELGSDHSHCG